MRPLVCLNRCRSPVSHNDINRRLTKLLNGFAKPSPDIVCLEETKAPDTVAEVHGVGRVFR
jgi:exonuclease III